LPNLFPPLTVYLDANVLFSASLSHQNDFLDFWRMHDVTPAVSPYAVEEVRRNIESGGHHDRLDALLLRTLKLSDGPLEIVPRSVILAQKDRPILATAIFASVDYLVTGDKNHFSDLYGTTVSHVQILPPREFLDLYEYRLIL
jgi:predicted nucleic acid-binding protein